ncbi:hypothetical protein FA15DRAFT_123167 [Coprinopsis marcescibilis]|uniref:Uncharacterized protein n=1 Tax=Coprinopsis marcescibilis TaxID=230819 RepID=A0A5C3KKT2_COPMA|nr:hypothetical protein FA15DRAFT_123167 [Coprinopsis marcescibilis]
MSTASEPKSQDGRSTSPIPVASGSKGTVGHSTTSIATALQLAHLHAAKNLQTQQRLLATLDALDALELTHSSCLSTHHTLITQHAAREKQLKSRVRVAMEVARKKEEEMEEMREVLDKLIERVEEGGLGVLRPAGFAVTSLVLEGPSCSHIRDRRSNKANGVGCVDCRRSHQGSPATQPLTPNTITQDDLAYTRSLIQTLRQERDTERQSHQQTILNAQKRIRALEAQISRREAELARCTHRCTEISALAALNETASGTTGAQSMSLKARRVGEREMDANLALDYGRLEVGHALDWAISRNRTLELEIQSLADKVCTHILPIYGVRGVTSACCFLFFLNFCPSMYLRNDF